MVTKLVTLFKRHPELGKIDNVEWDEYNLNIRGENWSLNTTSAWRIASKNGFFGINDVESKSELALLNGAKIISIETMGRLDIDFTILLDNEITIDIFCTTYFEPWVFNFKNDVTLVPSI